MPIHGKIFERLIVDEAFSFLLENNLVSPSQSGLKSGDFCITREMFQSFDERFEVSSLFLDISKAFDKILHKRQMFKPS